jgi:transposase-like protein
MTAVEIITSKEKRRYWTRAEKMRWILALNEPDANASDVARRAGVSTSLLYRWRQQLAAAGDGPAFVPIAFGARFRLTVEGAPDEATLSCVIDALAGHDRRR